MKIKTVKHRDGNQYAEIHTDPKSDSIIVRTFSAEGKMTRETDYQVVSISEVVQDVDLWATI